MGDLPFDGLGGKTPLEVANTPMLDRLAGNAREYGTFKPIPEGFPAGSDVGNMVLLGYDPRRYFTGRSPLEAAAMGVPLKADDVCFRCNLVTFVEKDGQTLMDDYAAGHIDTKTAAEFVGLLQKELSSDEIDFHAGVSFRHLMVWHGGTTELEATPPHDILGQPIDKYLPSGTGASLVRELNERSRELFADCEINRRLKGEGRKEVSSIWL
jgi:2,3-bisphosphoglycerate-independent phosphoglycerate mutase